MIETSQNPPERTICLIGVGLVGRALAERFLQANWQVIGCDVSLERQLELTALGGQAVSHADDVFAATDFVVVSLPTSEIASGVLDAVNEPLTGKTVIDTTTGEPEQMAALGRRLIARGARYLDATIAGSSAQVRAGEVILMVGGDSETVAACDELFRCFASHCFHVGPVGAGARMKLVVNLVLGLNRAVLAEGLCFAERCGVDPHRTLEVLRAGPAYSRVMDTKANKMLERDFTPQARLAQHWKDVRLILSAGEQSGATLPLSTLHEQLLNGLIKSGFGELDNSAIIKAFQTEQLPRS
jgi:3-hydroxyisobutyrate dehydrogenase-like beta-hydroxyacid dehydrogenase